MSKHTPGPWTVKGPAGPDRDTAIIADGMIVAETWGHVAEGVRADSFAAASRIVACVNACEEIDDPAEFIRIAKELIADIRAMEVK